MIRKDGTPSKTKYAKISLRKVEKLAGFGLIDKEIAEFFDIHVDTVADYKKKHPEFSYAIKKGKLKADKYVAESLYHRARGYEHPEDKIFCSATGKVTTVRTIKHYPPDTVACIFWLKNRQPDKWRDRERSEGLAIDISVLVVKNSPKEANANSRNTIRVDSQADSSI